MLIQIIVTIGVVLFVFPSIYASFSRRLLTIWGLILWFIFWTTGIIVIWIPGIIRLLGEKMGVARSIDALVYISIVYLLYSSFKQKIRLAEIKKEITLINRKAALGQINKAK